VTRHHAGGADDEDHGRAGGLLADLDQHAATSLLSESYLATRRRDLGGEQADFVYAITKLAEEEA
jgi:hypothetical protein